MILCFTYGLSVACASAPTNIHEKKGLEGKSLPLDIRAELSSQEVVSGTLVALSVNIPSALRNQPVAGEFEAIHLPFFEQASDSKSGQVKMQTLLGVPYDRKPGPGKVKVFVGEGQNQTVLEIPLVVKEGNYPSEVLHVDGRRVNPKKKDLIRIKKEQAEVAKVYKHLTLKKYWNGPFKLPITSKVTSVFGTRRVFNGELKNFHPGLDLKAAMNTPIFASAPGEVVLAKNLFYSGNTVMIDHGYGVITLYAHLNKIQVKSGDIVETGTKLGLSGKTGRVNGPHLHFQAVVHQVKVNPTGLWEVIQ